MQKNIFRKETVEPIVVTLAVTSILLLVTWHIASRPLSPEAERLQAEIDFLSAELSTLKEKTDRSQAREIVLEREARVVRQANRLLQESESERQAELNRLQSELDFYRRLAGTGGAQSGLDVYRAEIFATDSERVFQFALTLTQNIRRASIITGRVRLDIEGTKEDRPVTLFWAQVSDGETPEPAFRFKYFQQLEGYLTLPQGFSPTRVLVTLEARDKRKPVVRSFGWQEMVNEPDN
jgi:hypothetical protein